MNEGLWEKVVTALACCIAIGADGFPLCENCPYQDEGTCPSLDEMHRDALLLLLVLGLPWRIAQAQHLPGYMEEV